MNRCNHRHPGRTPGADVEAGPAVADPLAEALRRVRPRDGDRLRDGSRVVLADLLRDFARLARVVRLDWLLEHWPEILREAGLAMRGKTLAALRSVGADQTTEELAVACLQHARESLAGAFRRVERAEYRGRVDLLALLHLHAELILTRRLAPYHPVGFDPPSIRIDVRLG